MKHISHIGWFNSAPSKVRRALAFDSLAPELRFKVKAAGRAARACCGLGKYDEAIDFTRLLPDDKDLADIARKCQQRKRERARGEYNWLELYRRSQQLPYRPDIADYQGPVEIRQSTTLEGQRGMFVTRDVQAGELLVSMISLFFASASDKRADRF